MSSNANHKIRLATMKAGSRGKVQNKEVSWSALCKKLAEAHRDPQHTHSQYLALSVDEKNKSKDVGSYVTGQFDGNLRKRENLKHRSAVSLDVDSATLDQMEWFGLGLSDLMEYEFFATTTRSHTITKPKWRFIFPTKDLIPAEHFPAVSRILSSHLFDTVEESMDAVDDVSHRAAQIMYWPSVSKDGEFKSYLNRGKLLDHKALLDSYEGWEDWSKLPYSEKRGLARPGQVGPAERPRTKAGLVGAFCRSYNIMEAMERFIPGVYIEPKKEGRELRYNYAAGHGSKGAVVYDDGDFLYSYHGTDPCGERNVNAFDMVRLHLFGTEDKADDDSVKSMGQQPSWKAMEALVRDDKRVQQEFLKARLDVGAMFDNLADPEPATTAVVPVSPAGRVDPVLVPADWDEDLLGPAPVLSEPAAPETYEWDEDLLGPDPRPPARVQAVASPVPGRPTHDPILDGDYDEILETHRTEWLSELDLGEKGEIKNSLSNVNVILKNDPRIKGSIAFNSFTDIVVLRKPMALNHSTSLRIPVRDLSNGDQWETHHDANLRTILEAGRGENRVGYGMKVSGRDLTDGVLMVARTQAFHPIKDIWESVEWDGHGRVETLLTDYLGCEDNEYHRDVARNMMLAMVTRVYEPGHKFDYTAILEGGQGIGKSTFLKKLSMGFFAEMSNEFDDDKKSVETMRGALIVEMPELQQFNRADVTAIKGFMSKSFDKVRMSYDRRETVFQRRCVFWGSTNEDTYLRDTTGNRRFWPVKTKIDQIDNPRLERNVPQLYAEALSMYRQMRTVQPYGDLPLTLIGKALGHALLLQDSRRVETDEDAKVGMIDAWLDKPIRRAISTGEETVAGDFDPLSDSGDEIPHETVQRDTVCLLDVFVDCLGGTRENYRMAEARAVGNAFKQVRGWVEIGRKRVPRWGLQRVYGRVGSPAVPAKGKVFRK